MPPYSLQKAKRRQKVRNFVMNSTKHGYDRIDERLNIKNAYKKERQIRLAFERGLGKNDERNVPKKLIEYMIIHEERNGRDATVKIYNGAAYIFGYDGQLVTVWVLPKEFRKIYESAMRKINRRGEDYIAA